MADIAKISVEGAIHDIKDAVSRQSIAELQQKISDLESAISKLKPSAYKEVATAIANPTDNALPTELAVKNYVDTRIQAINVHSFDVVVPKNNKLPTASADTMYKLYFIDEPKTGAGTYTEYITLYVNNAYVWEQVGYNRFF